MSLFKITLSPGHGLHTPGKRTPDGMHEWEFNAAVVTKMIDLFSHYKDVAVKRLDDPTGKNDIPLETRAKASNNWNADYHLDVHANAAGDTWSDAHGIETFSFGLSGKSFEIAKVLQKALVNGTGLADRGVKNGDWLYMVRTTKAPANLVECGFMSNKNEAALLKSDAYREKIANTLVNAIAGYFKLEKVKEDPKPAAKPKTDAGIHKVQVGAFSDPKNAEKLAEELKKKGYKSFIVKE
ncbi:N-acetylmuramoyl-L-alanine amidase [Bacillus sp. UNC438CL73TsuS30]|uniref:N-acetylmuramoyl-L-alanine amidase n=1 Tax=Bacillus sp. UNC438CL73TsuS30 TaxID=1340434 RepID=UPI00047919AC|nr:N-acetylmuramoyl-L-alanine amidase [Bacillus sp. UNC438CL73TsuS30]